MKNKFLVLSLGFLLVSGAILTDVACNKANIPSAYNVATITPTATYTFTITQTPTNTGTPTNTPIASPIVFNVTVNYNGVKTGVSYNIVDQAGVTVATTTNTVPYSYVAYDYGTYTINILPNNPYALSSQTVLVTGPGLVTVPFSSSGWSLSTNPTSLIYQSSSGYQTPVTVLYSASGNLNVPAVITTGGLASAFSVAPSSLTLQPNTSGPLTITKGACYVQNTSLNFSASDNQGGSLYSTSAIAFNKGFTVNVSLTFTSTNTGITGPFSCAGGCLWTNSWTDTLQLSDGGLGCSYNVTFDGGGSTLSNGQSASSGFSCTNTLNPPCSTDPGTTSWTVILPNGSTINYPSTTGSY